jgi:hypothetical protein
VAGIEAGQQDAIAALTAVLHAAVFVRCLGTDLCSSPGTEAWWATIGRMAVYSPIVSFMAVAGVFMIGGIASTIGAWRSRKELTDYQGDEQETQ